MMGDLCVTKAVPPPGSRRLGGPVPPMTQNRSVYCEASRNLRWTITNAGVSAPVYKLTLPNPDMPGNDQPLFQISKPNPNDLWWTMFYFTYGGHMIPPKRIEFGRIQKNAVAGNGGGAGTRITISGRTPEEKAVWQTLGEGNEDMVEWIVLCAALNLIDEEIVKAAGRSVEQQQAQQSPQVAAASQRLAATQGPRNSANAFRQAPLTQSSPPTKAGMQPPRKSGFRLFSKK